MFDFFDKAFFQQLIVGILLLALSILIGLKNIKSYPVTDRRNGTGWKIATIIAWLMIIVGLYLFVTGMAEKEMFNERSAYGFFLLLIGIIVKLIAKFSHWWKKD